MYSPVRMDNSRIIYLVLILNLVFVCDLQNVEISRTAGTYDEWLSTCQPFRRTNGATHSMLEQALVASKVSSTWVPVVRHVYSGWYWLDGSYYGETISAPEWSKSGRDCALLRVEDKMIEDVECSTTYQYFVCQYSGSSCAKLQHEKCFEYHNMTYSTYSMKTAWIHAKIECENKNGKLAVLPLADRTDLMDKLAATVEKWSNIWIGLRKADYVLDLGKDGYQTLRGNQWLTGEPCSCIEKKCTILQKQGNATYLWRSENCSAHHHFLCRAHMLPSTQVVPESTSSSGVATQDVPFTTTAWTKGEHDHTMLILMSCLVDVVLVLAVIVLFIFVYRLWRRKRKCRDTKFSTDVNREDQLLNYDGENNTNEQGKNASWFRLNAE